MKQKRATDPGRITSTQTLYDREGKLPSGIEGTNVPDFRIPAVTIEDVDRSVFDLFEDRLKFEVKTSKGMLKCKTLFATGERAFLVKGDKPPKDKNGTLILPITSIKRTSIDQSKPGIISGRGMGTNTGDIEIKRRLSERDPSFQAIINRYGLKNQSNVSSANNELSIVDPRSSLAGRVASRRSIKDTLPISLKTSLSRNIFEIITMPFPHFYTAIYEITIWTQYRQHMNSILERFMTSYDAQGNQFLLTTKKGYWFVGYVDDTLSPDENVESFSSDERIVKCKFTMTVPAYLHGSERHGQNIPFRRFLSAPQISFGFYASRVPLHKNQGAPVGSGDIDKFALSDINLLDKRGDEIISERERIDETIAQLNDPNNGMVKNERVRLITSNKKGETVFRKVTRNIDDINI